MNLVSHFLSKFLSSELLPTLMQTIGIAFVTMLIPLVLFIFSMEKDPVEWDKIVILDKVINAKILIISFGLIFFPLFIWNYDSYILKLTLFLFFLCGTSFLINILFNSYRWIRTVEIKDQHDSNNFRNLLRFKYLEEVKNMAEKEKVWSLTWRNDIPNLLDERIFINKFLMNIDSLVRTDSLDMMLRYIQTFGEFYEKRRLYDRIILNDLFSKFIEWHFLFFKREQNEKQSDSKLLFFIYELQDNLTRLIRKFVLFCLQNNNGFSLFKILKQNIQEKDKDCVTNLFEQSICNTVFDNLDVVNQRYDFWHHYFPSEWKITKENLENPNNIISKIWLNEFFRWAPNRILRREDGKDFDKNLDDTARELFPSTEPNWWAKILTFIYSPWEDENRIKSLVKRGTNFGTYGRIFASWGDGSQDDFNDKFSKSFEQQIQATLELTLLLFKSQFTKENMKKLIKELEGLNYEEGTAEESRKITYISIFRRMINLIDQKNL